MSDAIDPSAVDPAGAEDARERLDALVQRVQYLEDLVEELIDIALVNRAGLLTGLAKGQTTRDELRKVYQRIEDAYEEARETGQEYRILPAAAAYFLEGE